MEGAVNITRRCKSSLPRASSRQNSSRRRALTASSSVPCFLSAKELRSMIYMRDTRLRRPNFAYFTLLTEDDSLPAALLLGWTLQKSGTRNDTVVMVTASVGKRSRNHLRILFDRVVEVDVISMRDKRGKNEKDSEIYAKRMTKCNLFQFIEYEKILYIEISVYIERNIDELFDLEAPAGISSFVNSAAQEKFHGFRLPQEHVKKAIELSRGIRGCLMLLTPSTTLYHHCQSLAQRSAKFNFIHPDEEFFSKFFMNRWTHIHAKYALVPWQVNRVSRDVRGVCLEAFKPWDDQCGASWEICEWRKKASTMLKDYPCFFVVFRKQKWLTEMESRTREESVWNS